MIKVICNGKIYQFYDSSGIVGHLEARAAAVTDGVAGDGRPPSDPKTALYTHDVAALVLERFEDMLEEKGITVPCADPDEQAERESDPDNGARIYGSEYSELLDGVESTVIDAVMDAARGAEIVRDVFSGTA